jgi:hypothetical protein
VAVAFDAVGPSSSGTSQTTGSSCTWSHTCGGTATAILVGVGVPVTAAAWPISATYGGLAMSDVNLRQQSNNSTDGGIQVFGLLNPPTGANNVVVSVSGQTFTVSNPLVGGSMSYTGVGSFGTPVAAFGASTTPSVTVSSSSGNMVAAFAAMSLAVTANSGTSRYRLNLNDNNAAGNVQGQDAAGAASVTLTCTHSSDWWGSIGVELIASGGAAPYPFELLTQTPRAY